MEAKEQQSNQRIDLLETRLNNASDMVAHIDRQLRESQQSYLKLQEKYQQAIERGREMADQAEGCITKSQAQQITQENEQLQLELANTRAAMITYKNLV